MVTISLTVTLTAATIGAVLHNANYGLDGCAGVVDLMRSGKSGRVSRHACIDWPTNQCRATRLPRNVPPGRRNKMTVLGGV